MRLILNLLWLVFGGLLAGIAWLLAAVLFALSIVGLPWARAAAMIGLFSLWPFGQTAVPRAELTGRGDLGTGTLGTLGNLIWLVLIGWWLALGHVAIAIPLACSIIGIPFAWQHLKLAGMALWPIGQEIVPYEVASAAYRR
ncbi:MAG TPA: YccF domain-containing protein [Aliidongia sp.]|nr:YccF domain-containing protein [Aliidongia sp.]